MTFYGSDVDGGCNGKVMEPSSYSCPWCLAIPEVIAGRVRPRHLKECLLGIHLRNRGIHPEYRKKPVKKNAFWASTSAIADSTPNTGKSRQRKR